jgi:cell division transport system permease protein
MDVTSILRRAARGMREEARLHVISVSSLTIAFLCLGVALLLLANLDALAGTWARAGRVTIFLRDGAPASEVHELVLALEDLPGVVNVTHVSSAEAREQFVADAQLGATLDGLPADAFPASLEVELAGGAGQVGSQVIAERVARVGIVEDVETYRSWFDQLQSLLAAARGVALGLAFLVLLCVLFVVANTIRLAVAGRREEIEIMKLCGASDRFVRDPFIVEGAVQGFVAALASVLVLLVAFVLVRSHLDASVASLAGTRTVFLHPLVAVGVLVAGAAVGAAGSALSLRRHLLV